MSIVTINKNDNIKVLDFKDIEKESSIKQIQRFTLMDELLIDINKKRYENAQDIINYIKSIRSPVQINKIEVTLLSLMDFFQKTYVSKTFKVNLSRIPKYILKKLNYSEINIISKINNFPHLIGISGIRDDLGNIISRTRPRKFLDGVLYQWILLNNYDDFKLDFEKLEVIPWMHQTLSNPTYILLDDAIKTEGTKLHADMIFIRRIFNSDKYSFHIVALKNENNDIFTFKSQFAIKKNRYHRINKMFDLKKATYDFYKEKKKVSR